MKIIGVEHSKGRFIPEGETNAVNYDNMIVYCTLDHGLRKGCEFVGQACKEIKVRTEVFFKSFPGIGIVSDVIGFDVEAWYDEHGKVATLQINK